MHVRVTSLSYDLVQEEKVSQIIDDQMTPKLRELPGFVSFMTGTDRNTGRGISISVWDDMEHADGFRTALGGLVQQFEAAGVSFDPPQLYELTR